jgi:hypothetical protein
MRIMLWLEFLNLPLVKGWIIVPWLGLSIFILFGNWGFALRSLSLFFFRLR